MPCGCGKKAATAIKGVGVKVSHIAHGHLGHAIESITGKQVLMYPRRAERIAICRGCDDSTWMSKLEHTAWLASHGVKVITHFNDLTELPKLPKYPHDKKRKTIFCRLCKCPIPEKAWVEDTKCPLGKWAVLEKGK